MCMDYLPLPGRSCENLNFYATSPHDNTSEKTYCTNYTGFSVLMARLLWTAKKIKSQFLLRTESKQCVP